jgi:uncharacterized protein (DUF1015 family)
MLKYPEMAKIIPFKGILYSASEKISHLVSPPYDEISPQAENIYKNKNPYNVVNLILPEKSDYQSAADTYSHWRKKRVLDKENENCFYIYEQTFYFQKAKKKRLGFFALAGFEEENEKVVLPHEKTFSAPKQDRLELMKKTQANLEPIFGLFSDKDFIIDKLFNAWISEKPPIFDFSFEDNTSNRLWKISDQEKINQIISLMADKLIFIADGHHRYEASKNLREEVKILYGQAPNGFNYVMMYFSNMDDEQLTILPTHRLIKINSFNLNNFFEEARSFFEIKQVLSADELFVLMSSFQYTDHVFGMYAGEDNFYFLRYLKADSRSTQKKLDVTILHTVLIEHILGIEKEDAVSYTRDEKKAKELVDEGKFALAFYLNPTRIDEIKQIATSFKVMPHKSTYFYPKVLSGLVMREII